MVTQHFNQMSIYDNQMPSLQMPSLHLLISVFVYLSALAPSDLWHLAVINKDFSFNLHS
jgi:hypothetical protein